MKLLVPKLKPGGRNPVQITEGGKVSAQASVRPSAKPHTVFMHVVKTRRILPLMSTKTRSAKQLCRASGFWNMLAISLCSSAIGLKVTVEATAGATFLLVLAQFTLSEVCHMRSILGDEQRALGERILIGHCLHLLYWSWWSDAFQASNLFIDGEGRFFEFTTRAHKSARSAE